MEKFILDELHWNISIPTLWDFLPRFLQGICTEYPKQESDRITSVAWYYSEVSLHCCSMNQFKPSTIALSCVILSLLALKHPHWSKTLAKFSYTPKINQNLIETVQELFKCIMIFPSSLTTSKTKYFGDALIPLPDALPFL
jgi:hypothetical protein